MKSVNLKKYVTLILFLVVTLGFTIGTHYLLKPVIDKQGVYGELIDVNKGSVLTKQSFTKGNDEFMIYRVSGEGDYVGGGSNGKVITKLMVNKDNIIVETEFELYEHTEGFRNPADKFIESLVTNKQNILEFTGDFEFDGSSGSTNSFKIIRESIYGLTLYIKGEDPIPPIPEKRVPTYEKLFGKEYTLENEVELVGGVVTEENTTIKRKDVVVDSNVVAHTYFIEGKGVKASGYPGFEQQLATMEIQVIVEVATSRILGVEINKENFNFGNSDDDLAKVYNYFDKLASKNIYATLFTGEEFELDENTGATGEGNKNKSNTITNVIKMTNHLAIELKKHYEFGEKTDVTGADSVLSEQRVKFDNNEYTIYRVEAIGDYIGGGDNGKVITVLVVNTNDIIVETYFELYEHSGGAWGKRSINFIKSLVDNKQDIKVFEPDHDFDGSTGSTNSFEMIRKSIYDLRIYITGEEPVIPEEPNTYEKLFGKGYTLSKDEVLVDGEVSETNTTITRKDVVVSRKTVAHTYFITGKGIKATGFPGFEEQRATMEIQVIVELGTSRILGVEINKENFNFGNSDGDLAKVYNFFNKLAELNIFAVNFTGEEFELDGDTGATGDDSTGTSNTMKTVIKITKDLATELKEHYVFGEQTDATDADSVLSEQTVVFDNKEYTIYRVEAFGKYIGSREGKVITNVVVDTSDIIIGTFFELYEHTEGYRNPADKFIASLVNTNITNFARDHKFDGSAGSTNSYLLIRDSIFDLRVYITGETPFEPTEINTYEELFGKDYRFLNEVIIKDGAVSRDYSLIKRYDVVVGGKVVAHTYFVEREGQKITGENYGQEPFASIELQIIVNPVTTRIMGVDINLNNYHHSNSEEYIAKVLNYFEELNSENVTVYGYSKNLIDFDGGTSSTEGGTNTGKLVTQMLVDLSDYVRTTMTLTSESPINKDFVFGEDTFTVLDYTMIDINGTEYFIYLVKGTGIYVRQNKADITTAIVLDENGIVVDTYFTDYKHTFSDGRPQHKEAMIAYLNHLVMNSKDIKTFLTSDVFDGSSGSTNSFKVVKNIFYALRLYVNDEVAINEGTVLTKTTKVVDGKTLITYQVYGYGAYRFNSDGSVRDEGAVITNITIDENNVIVATEFVVYEHTSGSFKDKSQAFIDSLVTNNQNILDFKLEDEFDGSAGSTNSFNVIRESIFGLTTYLKNGNK